MKHDAPYLGNAVNSEMIAPVVTNLVKLIKESGVQFDTVVFRGMSGALIAPIIAHRLKKEIIFVRKSEDNSHSSRYCEGHTQSQRFIIIDDFIASGETLRRCFKAIRDMADKFSEWEQSARATCVGVFLYDSGEYRMKTQGRFDVSFNSSLDIHYSKHVYVWNLEVTKNDLGKLKVKTILPNIPLDEQAKYGIITTHENNPADSNVVPVASLGGAVATPNLAIQI